MRFNQDHKNPPSVPIVSHKWIWDWFWDLSAIRGYDDGRPLSFFYDIPKWAQMTGTYITRQEIVILRQMDDAFMNALAAERAAQRERESNK